MNHKFKTGDVIEGNGNSLHTRTLQIKDINEKGHYVTCDIGHDNILIDSQKWIETNYKLVLENMENIIKVGDILHHAFLKKDYTVSGVNSNKQVQLAGLSGWNEPEWVAKYMTIKTKAVKQEIVGYELLKDLPGIPAGTKSSEFMGLGRGGVVFTGVTSFDASDKLLQDTTWFKPIYKAIKPTEVFVDTLAGQVKVNSKYVALSNGDMLRNGDVTGISNLLQDIKGSYNCYELKLETFKLGCKTFHVDDIAKIQEAIKQVQ